MSGNPKVSMSFCSSSVFIVGEYSTEQSRESIFNRLIGSDNGHYVLKVYKKQIYVT